jgi:hypothetical protein
MAFSVASLILISLSHSDQRYLQRPPRKALDPVVVQCTMVMSGPVLVLYGKGDAEWASCLLLDLEARGLDVTDERGDLTGTGGDPPRALVVVRSWRPGGHDPPPAALVTAVQARDGKYVVARRDWTKYRHRGPDADLPGATHQFALWDDYYQPFRQASGGSAGGGIGNLLDVLLRPGAPIDLPDGYVFISYHHETDGSFVHERMRPVLSRAGMTSWAYRSSERIPDELAFTRLDELVRRAGVLLVVSTPDWSTSWSNYEVEAAHRHAVPVMAVQPSDTPPSGDPILQTIAPFIIDAGSRTAARLVKALDEARRSPRQGQV